MPAVKKKPVSRIDNDNLDNTKVRNHDNDPFVVKKVEKARETLRNTDLSILIKT